MPHRVQTLKSALFHLANLGVSRARPVCIYRLDGERLPPGDWKVFDTCTHPDNPDAIYGFHVKFDGVAVDAWVEGLTADELAQAKAAYDHNVATLYPHVLQILDAREEAETAHRQMRKEFGDAVDRLRADIFGTAKRDGTSLHDASDRFHIAVNELKEEDMPGWADFKASEARLAETQDKAAPGMAGGLNWLDYMKVTRKADAFA